jgi:hypothetical protein
MNLELQHGCFWLVMGGGIPGPGRTGAGGAGDAGEVGQTVLLLGKASRQCVA